MDKKNKNNGFGLVEIVVASAIVSISLFALIGVVKTSFQEIDKSLTQKRAEMLAEEGIEVTKILRDAGWSIYVDPLSSGTAYYPSFNSSTNTWSLTTTNPGAVDGLFTRTIVFSDVYRRNSDQDIVDISDSAPKTLDSGTMLVTSRVTWPGEEAKILTYITNIFQN